MRSISLGLLSLFLCSWAFASDQLPGNKYYSIKPATPPMMINTADVDLLKWEEQELSPPVPAEKYDRQNHVGSWIEPPNKTT